MSPTRLLFVTGKGGTGKTTVAAALGLRAAALGGRALIVETAADGYLAELFGHRRLASTPQPLHPGVEAVRVDRRALVERYFARLLRFPFVSRRLLSSRTFNALTAAAPGITEFLLLEEIVRLAEPGRRGRPRYTAVVVDGPASGHALKMLRVPRTVASMVPAGPLAATAHRIGALLADPRRTHIVVVAVPEEMAVRETVETCTALHEHLQLRTAHPVLNRVFPRTFSSGDARAIDAWPDDTAPEILAARYAIARRREAERHIAHLRRALGVGPLLLRELFTAEVRPEDLHRFGRLLGRAVLS